MSANDVHFAGVRFPTLVHAQWALCFEDLFVPWQFRSRKLILGSGVEYEPDFWLPRQALWVQVGDGTDPEDFRRWQEFAAIATATADDGPGLPAPEVGSGLPGSHTTGPLSEDWQARSVLFSIGGIPAAEDMSAAGPRSVAHHAMYTISGDSCQWTACETCGLVDVENGRADRPVCGHSDHTRDKTCRADAPRLLTAYRLARQSINAQRGGTCARCTSPLNRGDLVSAGRRIGRRRWYHAECLLADLRQRHPRPPTQTTADDSPDARLTTG
ncbi:hypothetical protein [Actinoplanes couchii]|uniref:PARP-type domain-containing protein n=1 Tax=Actinoplanes couchii TaxID=403638 RepID=A0ABQ3XJM1_9ACTN|nr:hypothetical protein [Actinoplanes couchii]MDR6324394.1 hypothetical protein [Actinoplanes couchii]GID58605.1 hypothetical protein Aco03nite_070090 [Actinoplanes couchii]